MDTENKTQTLLASITVAQAAHKMTETLSFYGGVGGMETQFGRF